MSRYIDADKAIDVLHSWGCLSLSDAEKIVNRECPTADVVEVKHGRWIPQMIPTGVSAFGVDEMTCEVEKCSWCESEYWVGEEKLFCPHCGADMRGDKYE